MKRRSWVALILLAAAGVGACLWFRPRIRFTVKRDLVGPQDEAVALLFQGAALDEIKVAVRRSGKAVDQMSFLGASLLYHAVAEGRPDVALWVLEQGADPNGIAPSVAPLKPAVRRRDVAMVRLLLDHGANPDLDTGHGITPRWIAQSDGYAEILALFPARNGREPSGHEALRSDQGSGEGHKWTGGAHRGPEADP